MYPSVNRGVERYRCVIMQITLYISSNSNFNHSAMSFRSKLQFWIVLLDKTIRTTNVRKIILNTQEKVKIILNP